MLCDPVLLHTLFDIARSLHDSLDSLSFADDRRQISGLVLGFVRKASQPTKTALTASSQIDFGRDLEKQLNTYVECRQVTCGLFAGAAQVATQAFSNLDNVTQELVHK